MALAQADGCVVARTVRIPLFLCSYVTTVETILTHEERKRGERQETRILLDVYGAERTVRNQEIDEGLLYSIMAISNTHCLDPFVRTSSL